MRTKADIVYDIAILLGRPAPPMSTGSTEPKAIFQLVDESLGLGIGSGRKPELARRIVESAGQVWGPTYESRGDTVTRDGLEAVERAVHFFLGVPD